VSGIAGLLHFDGRPAEEALLQRMTAAMDYRGPDGIRHWCRGAVALGHCALVTTSEQLGEVQPLQNESAQVVLVFDGRLDNRAELRRELLSSGVRLRDETDAELVLCAYEKWEADCVLHMEGEFTLVIWDARSRSAFCARDRMGIRPFHYHWNGSTFTFASDVHAVLAMPWVPQELNTGKVAEALAVEHLSLDETFWRGVSRLPAATSMVVRTEGLRQRRYWEPDPALRLPCKTEADYVHYHRELLRDVMKWQSRSHKPVACEVSGGLDSSALFAVGHALLREQQLAAPALHGFALAFSDPLANESTYRTALSDYLGAAIQEVAPGRYPVSWYQQYGATYRDFAGFPNWTMMRPLYAAARAQGCGVVMNGTGGDEWLGAVTDWRSTALAARQWSPVLASLRQDAAQGGYGYAATEVLRWFASEVLPEGCKQWVRYRRGLPVPAAWLSADFNRSLHRRRPQVRKGGGVRSLQLAVLRDAFGQFGRELAERQAAMSGIERRQPFWDRRIVEAAFATPEWLRARDGDDKWLHRRAMEGLLPPAILERDDKADFVIMAKQQRPELTEALQITLARRTSWVRAERVRPPSEYVGGGALADFGQWALLMADALEPRPLGADQPG
jgi:asparagine synthase (glutamine-hydrolysing)